MEKRILGRTGLKVTIIGFGGIPIIDKPNEEAIAVVERALDLGINFIDTARAYERKNGPFLSSEEKIGEVMRRRRGEVVLATKTHTRAREGAAADIEKSLANLKTDYVDLLQLHAVDSMEALEQVLSSDGALAAVQTAQRAGKVRFIGITGHRPDVLLEALKTGLFDTVMVPVNIVDRFIYNPEASLLPYAEAHNIGVIVMKPLAGGALKENVPEALRYSMAQKVTTVIPGMGTVHEVEENVAIGQSFQPLAPEEEDRLAKQARALGSDFCRQCGYCKPCSVGIDIPFVFRLEGYFTRYGQKEWAKAQYAEVEIKASECIECGNCEPRCPYSLPIINKLKIAHARLTGLAN